MEIRSGSFNDPALIMAKLREIADQAEKTPDSATGVELQSPNGNQMHICPHSDGWILLFTEMSDGEPVEQVHAQQLGKPVDGADTIALCMFEWTEFPKSWLVERALAERLVETWLSSARLGPGVAWLPEGA